MISLHRYSWRQEPGDLSSEDLLVLWGLMRAECLVEIFFHDGSVRNAEAFLEYARDGRQWFYGAKRAGEWFGFIVTNGFSNSGKTAFSHFLVFENGRRGDSPFIARQHYKALMKDAELLTLVGAIPAKYRWAVKFAKHMGYVEKMRIPEAFLLKREDGDVLSDAVVTQLDLRRI